MGVPELSGVPLDGYDAMMKLILSSAMQFGLGAALLVHCPVMAPAEMSAVPIHTGWVMMAGDDPGWAAPDLNDAHWRTTRIDRPWEEAGLPDYDGFAWYRVHFVVPEAWRQHLRVQAPGGHLVLSLGPIDDVDVTYFNGNQIGHTGRMPPDYATAYDQERNYRIPAAQVRWGQTNTLAVRVYDHEAPGGIYRGPVIIRPPTLSDSLETAFQLDPSDGIYPSPGPITLQCQVSNGSSIPARVRLVAAFRSDHLADEQILKRIHSDLELAGHGRVSIPLEFRPPRPGFYRVTCTLEEDATPAATASMIVGYAPEDLATP